LNFYYWMNKQQLPQTDYYIFTTKSLLWLVFGWTAFLLTLAGFFYTWLVWAIFLAGAAALTFHLIKRKSGLKISKELLLVSIGLVIFVTALSFFVTPTVFSGRDQGSISQAAAELAQNHTLTFATPASDAFFKLHGAGRALNFPGFFYTSTGELTTQFPLVYISWLAAFYGVFGTLGFIVANAVLSLLFLFTFYFLARFFMPMKGALIAILFASTSLSVFWFPKYTLSENLALPLVWLAIFATLVFLKKQNSLNLLLLLAASILLIFTRIEGIAFFLVCAFIVFYNKNTRAYLKSLLDWKFFALLGFLFLVLLANTFRDINFYKEIVKAVIPPIIPPQATSLGEVGDPTVSNFYLLKIFYLYGLLSFFIISAIACIFYARQKNTAKLIPFFIVAPTLIYFFNSHISPDHPWMLRRFAFSLLPGAIFYCALLISDWQKSLSAAKTNPIFKLAPAILTIVLVIGNLPAFLNFATFSENKNLLSQTENLSQQFSAKDLVLIDRLATGDGWSMLAGPMNFLQRKNAVYFFNPDDLSKLDLKNFEHIYLVAPDNEIAYYTNSTIGSRLTVNNHYTLATARLELGPEASSLMNIFPAKKLVSSAITVFNVSR